MINHFHARIEDSTDGGESFSEITEHGLPDPFFHAVVIAGGWRVAWAALRGRYKIRVEVEANHAARQAVTSLIDHGHEEWQARDLERVMGIADSMQAMGIGDAAGACAACGTPTTHKADTSAYDWDSGFLCDDEACVLARTRTG